MTRTNKRLSAISLILIAVLIFTAIFSVLLTGGSSASAVNGNAAQTPVKNTFVQSDMNFDSIHEQYLKQELLQKNIASYDGKRWVIVDLDGDTLYDRFAKNTRYDSFAEYSQSVEGRSAQADLKAGQSAFLSKLDRHGIEYDYKYSYTAMNNGVAVKVDAAGYNAIAKMNGVNGVYYSESYAVPKVATSNNANVYTTGIYNSKDLDYKGEGMVVAILDTGLDFEHEAFQDMPSQPAWDKAYVESRVKAGLKAVGTADDFYYNSKVPFAYDYADDDSNVYPSYSSHGTHVAGIVAGKSEFVVNEETGEKFIGVAPEAQLVICKVFTDNLDSDSLGGADTIDILAAINDCTVLGVDVINMSLGTSAGFSDEKSDTYLNGIYSAVREAGISLIVAASNDYSSGFGGGNGTNLTSNPDSGTVGAPSTYPAALSVASINGQKSSYITANDDENQVAFITRSSDQYGVEFDFIEQLYTIAGKQKGQDLRFKYVVISGVGRPAAYTSTVRSQLNHANAVGAGYDGTIALVRRGDTTFAEKVQAAMSAGADACIIYNNLAGTIRMSLGEVENPIPTCSITMDAGKVFVANADANTNTGVINVNSNMEAGPFMSDFSSWGPTPSLELKPEITAHGGEITSAVAGGYDKYSGTSMAAPNMAGAVALLRQYLKKTNPDLSGKELNARVNQVLMSTATIANNEEGNPYSPRKQGAGLAGIADAIAAEGYLTVLEKGEVRDKTKIELYDDPDKTGIYTLEFVVNNTTNSAQTYIPSVNVMTETVSSDEKTVAEKAYLLTSMCNIQYYAGATASEMTAVNGVVSVPAKSTVSMRIVINLNQKARDYLDSNFKNGMYVEGFVSLAATGATKVTLGLPYLAFYGDWTDAPLFDYDMYELAESEKDTNIPAENKLKASAADTKVLGRYWGDKYIWYLGTYAYEQDEENVQVYPERDKVAISMYDAPNERTIYELYMVYAGLLRCSAYMDIVITDATTGDVIFEQRQENIGKSYAAGGSNRGAPVMLEIRPGEWGLINNSTYNVSLKGQLDYAMPEGKELEKDSFDFQFTIDYEAPQMLDYRIRYVPYTENRVVKYKIWMDVDVYDNQYVQAVLPCYIDKTGTKNTLRLVTEYAVPVNGQKGEMSTVSFEITDIYEDYVKTGQMYIQIEDYAMNAMNYNIVLGKNFGEDAKDYPESVEFVADGTTLVKEEETGVDSYNNVFNIYRLNVEPYTLYKLNAGATATAAQMQTLVWTGTGTNAKAKADEIFTGAASRETRLNLTDETGKIYARVIVTPQGAPTKDAPQAESITFNAAINADGYVSSLDSSVPSLEVNPGQTLRLDWSVAPWYCNKPTVTWTSRNPSIVTVDDYGNITPLRRGRTQITVTSTENELVSKTVQIIVGGEFDVRNYTLYECYGSGEIEIPNDMNIMYLDEECFQGKTSITKIILPTTLTQIPIDAFKGCTGLEEIVIPGQCIVIGANAFEGCTSLEKVTLGMFVDGDRNELGDEYHGTLTLGRNAFKGCTSLTTIENSGRLTTLSQGVFENCTALESIDISGLRVAGAEVFKGCTRLKTVITSSATRLGEYMFDKCSLLESFTVKSDRLPAYVFSDCKKLSQITIENPIGSIGTGAFNNTAIRTIKLPDGAVTLDASAFSDCTKLTTVTLSAGTVLRQSTLTPFTGCINFQAYEIEGGNSASYSVADGALYSKDGTQLVAVPYGKKELTLQAVKSIGRGALSGVKLESLDLSAVETLEAYALAGSQLKSVVLPSGLTSIPDGLFDGCKSLASVTAADGFVKVLKVGQNAFRGCEALSAIALPNLTDVGDSAFAQSGLRSVPSTKIEKLGVRAFAGSSLKNVSLPALKTIGMSAFANISELRTIEVGGITSMGEGVFIGSQNITSVTFGEGTTEIGFMAFYSETPVDVAITIVLPNTVKYIYAGAFYNLAGLKSINLTGVEAVGDLAFADTGLETANLSNIQEIGALAFRNTKLTSAKLAKAEFIDAGAFFGVSTLTDVKFEALQVIGASAFEGTSLTVVHLPAAFNYRTYKYSWEIRDEKYRVTETKTRNERAYGQGAFANIPTLESIDVANGSDDFFSVDGVLYSRVTNGYVIEQYPVNKEGASYKVLDGTVFVSDSAFEGVAELNKVELPYSVTTIGSFAFFNSAVREFVFNSVDAPVLLSEYTDLVYDTGFTRYNANFGDEFVFKTDKLLVIANGSFLGDNESLIKTLDLKMTIPLNGRGYDTYIWQMYFNTVEKTDEIMAESITHEAINAVNQFPTVEEIATLPIEDVLPNGRVGKLVGTARRAYNVLKEDSAQLEFFKNYVQKLLDTEKALRDRKTALGHPVTVSGIEIVSNPNKRMYQELETFDSTGMVVEVVFDDDSKLEVTDFTVKPCKREAEEITNPDGSRTEIVTYVPMPDKLRYGTDFVSIEYTYGGKTVSGYLRINVERNPDLPPYNPTQPGNDKDNTLVIILATVIPAAVLLIAGAVAAVLIVRKKKSKATEAQEADVAFEEAAASGEGEETQAQEAALEESVAGNEVEETQAKEQASVEAVEEFEDTPQEQESGASETEGDVAVQNSASPEEQVAQEQATAEVEEPAADDPQEKE